MHAYVINLERSPDRRAHIIAELSRTGLDYEIITGVDGRDLDLRDPAVVAPSLVTGGSFPAGVAGTALSHLKVYQKIIADGLDQALVLEDDAMLPTDLNSLANVVADQLTGAEVALLYYLSENTIKISTEGSVHLPSARRLALPIDIGQVKSAVAYIITREACERMRRIALPVRVNSDDWGFFYKEGALDRVRCVVPLTVGLNYQFRSTIGTYGLGNGIKADLLEPLLRYNIPFLQQVISRRRQRISRRWTRSEMVDMPFTDKPSRLDETHVRPSQPGRADPSQHVPYGRASGGQ
jgi:glycosyl transferase, family 25